MKTIVVCPECGTAREKYSSDLLRLKSAYCFACSHPAGPRNLGRHAAIIELVKQGVSYAEIGRRQTPQVTRERIRQIVAAGLTRTKKGDPDGPI